MNLPLAQWDWSALLALIAAVILVWFVLRAVLKLALRVFSCGCALIFLAALALIVWRIYAARP